MVDVNRNGGSPKKPRGREMRCGLTFDRPHGLNADAIDRAVGEFLADHGTARAIQELGYWLCSLVRSANDLPGVPFVITYVAHGECPVPQLRIQVDIMADLEYREGDED